MNKKERVLAAIKGSEVDFIPSGFSLHFPTDCHSGEKGVNAHLDFFEKTDTDILKIMNENTVPDFGSIKTPDDWSKIPTLSINDEFMKKQLEMTKRIMDKADPNAFIIGTVHGICASAIHPIEARYGYEAVRELMCAHLRENKKPVIDAFKRIADVMCRLVEGYKDLGLDGIYYAALGGEKHFFTTEEFNQTILPFDYDILKTAKTSNLYTFLHICKENIDMDRYKPYNDVVDVVNWGIFETDFSIEKAKELFAGKTIMGGLANRSGVMVDGTIEELVTTTQNIISKYGNDPLIIGADCTLPTEIPYERINAIVNASKAFTYKSN